MDDGIILRDAAELCARLDLRRLAGRTVVITGASGLIGTYLVATLARLQAQGVDVQVKALCHSEPPPHMKEICGESVEILRLDLADFAAYDRLPEADFIIHSAGYAQPSLFMADPVTALQTNTSATVALLKRLRPGGSFLFVGSSEIYSGLNQPLLSESDIGRTSPSHPRAAYI